MSTDHKLGTYLALYGNPYTAQGQAGAMAYLGATSLSSETVIDPQFQQVYIEADQAAGPIKAYGYYRGTLVTMAFLDQSKAGLTQRLPGLTNHNGAAVSAPDGLFEITGQVLLLVPQDEVGDGTKAALFAAPHAFWLFNAVPEAVGVFRFQLPQGGGGNAANPMETRFLNLSAATLGVDPAKTIPAEARKFFMGNPTEVWAAAETDAWAFPDLTAIALT